MKRYDDYALFVTQEPGLELALDLDERAASVNMGASHFGIAVDNSQAVDEAIERLRAAGLTVEIERGETCCYARQDKVWARDPEGRRWEIYYVLEEADVRASSQDCCTADTCQTFAGCCGAAS